jgi:hypothetical protein
VTPFTGTPEFTQAINSWQTFYLLVGTAAVTLIGLLFVAVTINIEAFRRNTDMQLFGALTFNCFFYVLFLAIFFVIPGQSPLGLGVPLLLLGGLALVNAFQQYRRAQKMRRAEEKTSIAQRFIVPMVCLLLWVIISIAILLAIAPALYGLVAVALLLLGSASQNAWELLIRSGRAEKEPLR